MEDQIIATFNDLHFLNLFPGIFDLPYHFPPYPPLIPRPKGPPERQDGEMRVWITMGMVLFFLSWADLSPVNLIMFTMFINIRRSARISPKERRIKGLHMLFPSTQGSLFP